MLTILEPNQNVTENRELGRFQPIKSLVTNEQLLFPTLKCQNDRRGFYSITIHLKKIHT